jgi:hypothetical protein
MYSDSPTLETALKGLQASPLDEATLDRLEAVADGTLTTLNPEEIRFENRLREVKPTPLSADFMAQLEAIVHEVPFSLDEKIVLFPKASQTLRKSPKRRAPWAAAAAVALIGAASALLIPNGKAPQNTIALATPPASEGISNANLVPASFNRGVSEVHDEGVVWKSDSQPHRVVRVVYKDLINCKDAQGRLFQVERPRVEYLLVPARAD